MPSEVAKVFEKLPTMFQKGAVKTPRTFYFSLDDDEKWTVVAEQGQAARSRRASRTGTPTASSRPASRCSSTCGTASTRPPPRTS